MAAASPSGRRKSHKGAESLRHQAYELIKRRIITLEFRPGEYLNESEVSKILGIGRTPVHQAMDRLMLEGMVEIIPRKGVIVKPVSLLEVMQIIDVRLQNEVYCVRQAAGRAGPELIAELEAIMARAPALLEAQNVEGLMDLDREFHAAISAAAGNQVLAELLLTLHERSLRFWFISLSDPQHLQAVQFEHREILEALEVRDAEAAGEAMRRHIEDFRHNIGRSI